MARVKSLGLAVRQVQQAFAAQLLVLVGHHVRYLQGSRSGALGIREHVQLGYVKTLQELVSLLEQFGTLAARAYHNVDADERIGHHFLYQLYLVGEQRAVITAVHKAQHFVRTTLQRYVEMGHERPAACTILNQFVVEQVGLYAAYAVTLYSLDAVECLNKVNETLVGGLAEVAYVDSGQHNLLSALGSGLSRLPYKRLYTGVTAESTRVWDGAIRTEIIATVLHLEEITRTVAARTARRKCLNVLSLNGMKAVQSRNFGRTRPCF